MALSKNFSITRSDFATLTNTPISRGLVLNNMQVEMVHVSKAAGDTSGSFDLSGVQRPNKVYALIVVDSGTTGTQQVETQTIVVTTVGAGNITVTVTSALLPSSPKAITVAVGNNNTAAQVAAAVRAALDLDPEVGDHFTVGGTGANVTLTAKVAAANDATLNIAIALDTATGVTADATSDNTTAGVAPAYAEPTLAELVFTHTDNDTIAVSGLGTWTAAYLLVCGRSYS